MNGPPVHGADGPPFETFRPSAGADELPQNARRPTRRRRRWVRWVLLSIAAVIVIAVVVFLIWANTTYAATPDQLHAVQSDSRVNVAETGESIVMTPADPDASAAASGAASRPGASGAASRPGANAEIGLVFIPGAKVDPHAYEYNLQPLVYAGFTVVITKPILNLALFDLRPLSTFTSAAPRITTWWVGGHSLGGVRACQYAGDGPTSAGGGSSIRGLVLFGSYCASDFSGSPLPVLSVSASNDGLSTPDKIEASKPDLPADTSYVVLEGADHGDFGNYGAQPGDGPSTRSPESVQLQLSAAVIGELETIGPAEAGAR